jgi:hypothetical protein
MAIDVRDRDLELPRVFELSVRALTRRPVAALLLAALSIYLPELAFLNLMPSEPVKLLSLDSLLFWLGFFGMTSLSAIFHGWVAFQVVDDRARKPLVEVAARALPFVITFLVLTLFTLLGMLALVVPGVIIAIACTAAIPAAAIERLNPMQAINRSVELTENRRWAILGFTLAMVLPPLLAASVFEWMMNDQQLFPDRENPVITYGSRPITDALQVAWGGAVAAALYAELRRLGPLGASRNPTPEVSPP